MNRYLKILLFIAGVLAIAYIIDYATGICTEKYLLPKQDSKCMYAYNGGGGEEIVIFGSSRAARHYVSSIFEDSLGVKCFNYGCDGENIYYHYAILNVLLSNAKKKPRIVILDLANRDIVNIPGNNTEKLSALHLYYALDDTLKSVVNLQGRSTSFALSVSSLYANNSNINVFIKPFIGGTRGIDNSKGYAPSYSEWNKPIEIEKEEWEEIDSCKVEYLRRFVSRCLNDSIEIVLFNSPHFLIFNEDRQWIHTIEEIASEFQIQYLDYEQDSFYLKHPELFKDPLHLNNNGAIVYTNTVIPKIKPLI